MENIKFIFNGDPSSQTDRVELKSYATDDNFLLIELKDGYNEIFILLNRKTAVKFSKEIKKQIGLLEADLF